MTAAMTENRCFRALWIELGSDEKTEVMSERKTLSDWRVARKPRLIGFPTPLQNLYAYQEGCFVRSYGRHHGQSTRDPVPDATRYLRSINAFPSHQSLHLSRTDRLRQLGSLVSGDEFQQHKAIAATGVDILLAQAQSNAVFARDDIEQSKIVRR